MQTRHYVMVFYGKIRHRHSLQTHADVLTPVRDASANLRSLDGSDDFDFPEAADRNIRKKHHVILWHLPLPSPQSEKKNML
jgi:hypothetical protein